MTAYERMLDDRIEEKTATVILDMIMNDQNGDPETLQEASERLLELANRPGEPPARKALWSGVVLRLAGVLKGGVRLPTDTLSNEMIQQIREAHEAAKAAHGPGHYDV